MRRSTITAVACAVALSVAGVLVATRSVGAQKPYVPIPDAEEQRLVKRLLAAVNEKRMVGLTHFDQTQDVQQLVQSRRVGDGEPPARMGTGKTMVVDVADGDLHALGYVQAKPGASRISMREFGSPNGGEVGSVWVTENVKSLELLGMDENRVVLYRNGNGWTAKIGGRGPLRVTRYTYKNLENDDKYYPDNGRWDWERGTQPEAPERQVIGLPCGHGWCLVGTVLPPPNDNKDPLDPDKDGDRRNFHHERRVPGWFDRAINSNDPSKTDWIYPHEDLAGYNDPNQLVGRFYPVATIEDHAGLKNIPVGLQYFPAADPDKKWQVAVAGKTYGVAFNVKSPDTPSGVRWKKAVAPLSATAMTNGIWMRCPNGCCDATITY